MSKELIAKTIEAAFREGWRMGEEEGRAYGFTGRLASNSNNAWLGSKARKAAKSPPQGAQQ